jgi:4-hydroxy-tetrahydrodipicolinate synthase
LRRRGGSTIASIRSPAFFYSEPLVDMHNRMKEALVLLGRLPRAVVRPPLVKLESAEIARIRQALIDAGLLDKTPGRHAA